MVLAAIAEHLIRTAMGIHPTVYTDAGNMLAGEHREESEQAVGLPCDAKAKHDIGE